VTVIHEHQDFKANAAQFDFSLLDGAATIQPAVLLAEIVPIAATRIFHPAYDPPLRSQNRTIALQVFII
jgi:hypothetical protein